MKIKLIIVSIVFLFSFSLMSKDKTEYKKKDQDSFFKNIKKEHAEAWKAKKEKTKAIISEFKEKRKEERLNKKVLLASSANVKAPQKFDKKFHFPPQAQDLTSTCWAYCTTSYFESEIYRLHKKKIKLSEMWTPYYEYLEKAMAFIETRGNSYVSGGGQSNGVIRIWKKYGIVPLSAYDGRVKNMSHKHTSLMKEIKEYLSYVKRNNLWDSKSHFTYIRAILDKYMGRTPEKFTFEGKKYTPKEFLASLKLNLDDYVSVMSTKSAPFYTFAEYKVPDNWWHSQEYLNLPLDVWYKVILRAVKKGYTVAIGGDVSEPGVIAKKDLAFIPTFDILTKNINQDSREYRIYNGSTSDDHGIHLVGYTNYKGFDWFLIKDSGHSSRKGKMKGYYRYRGDFVKLKMLTFTINKNLIKDILKKVKK